jgi:pimeloyl-ACP methyl ester carboxylesterase
MGRSEPLPPEFGIDFLAECILRIADTHELEQINVIAASYGTPTAFRFAQLHPERVGKVVLAGTMKEIPRHIRDQVM